MGQATVDLPDPLKTPAPTTSGGTDDLLAQLAGEEIDRLLADADVEASSAAQSAALNSPAADPAVSDLEPVTTSHAGGSAPGSSTAPSPQLLQKDSDPELAAALDNLLDGLDEKLAETPAPPGVIETAKPAVGVETRNFEPTPGPEPGESGTSSSERHALTPQVAASDLDALDAEAANGPVNDSLPFYLKPLEWLNAPLAGSPDYFRDAIGKIAILTLVNAAAILIYVRFIRRH